MPELQRVLIANRGEIAIRIARAAAGLGAESVAVYPDADDRSLHTRLATTSVRLDGPADHPVAAYLDVSAVVAAAVDAGCDSVHPGYGFLAENADLAEASAAAGLVFIGPSPEVLRLFGDKVAAREAARELGIPVVPGTDSPVADASAAMSAAEAIGFPVMVKAAAGGGGRGMRIVREASELADAVERCRSEALAAFGDDRLFVERLVERPRHIEVQILGDSSGAVVHVGDRDCSVQLRHQKVIEVAPAAGLDEAMRTNLLDDAVRLAASVGVVGAATVEFLVEPETGAHYFIECNPRIQVEHTVTEAVTGLDLVELQMRLAAGVTLAELGLGDQAAVPEARGFAVQARVVATGPGTMEGYKEPTGAGVRVDAAGYAGYTPPPQFDPLVAKVIGSSGSAGTLDSALSRTRAAVAEFHIEGLPTNLGALHALLGHPDVQTGNARTTLLAEQPELLDAAPPGHTEGPLALFGRSGAASTGSGAEPTTDAGPGLGAATGQTVVISPGAGTVLAVSVEVGDEVAAGDTVMVLTAMKMETNVTAPCAGTVMALAAVASGDAVVAGRELAVIDPAADGAGRAVANPWEDTLDQVETLRRLAHERLAPGSDDPGVVRQRSRNKLTCRERIDELLDDGSFREVGSVAGFASRDEDGNVVAFTPANQVGGSGTIESRPVVVCADDFTSRGGHSDGAIAAKSTYLDRLSTELRIPSVRLLDGSSGGGSVASMVPQQRERGEAKAEESSGAISAGKPRVAGGGGSFLPPHLGSSDYAAQLATVPVVNVLLGSVVGLGAAKAVLGHFSVMVRDIAQLFVAGPPVVSHAMGYDVTKEELGGWHIHCRNGSVDNLAETEAEAMAQTRRFLSYLPSSVYEAPPVTEPPAGERADRRDDELAAAIPRKRTTTFDMRRVIELIVDDGSFFEIGRLWGSDQIVGLARCDGHAVGVVASDSRHINGGAITADGCDKVRRHIDLCDLFHLPVLNLVDNPGFAVGIEHEIAGTIRKGGEWMVAWAQASVPMFTVLLRRSFGVAGNNFAAPRSAASRRVAWPSADVGGIPPEGGIEAAYKRQLAEAADPVAFRAELEARIESARGPLGPLSRFEIEEMIDPRDTRPMICEWLPTAYRAATGADRLVPRGLQYRP